MYANFNNVIHQTNNNLHSTEKDEEEESEKKSKNKTNFKAESRLRQQPRCKFVARMKSTNSFFNLNPRRVDKENLI